VKQHLDFIVIGAQKAGTTALFEHLRQHPQLALPVNKEMPYFSHDRIYSGGFAQYVSRALPQADPARRWGTVTPHYMYGAVEEPSATSPLNYGDERTVPQRIHRYLPDIRLLAILRDPVERALSHHAMTVMNGRDNRAVDRAMSDLLAPEAVIRSRRVIQESDSYITRGEYGRILSGYLDVFSSDRLLVIYAEDLKANPAALLRRVFKFLDVETSFVPDNLGAVYRPRGAVRRLQHLDLGAARTAAANSRAISRTWWSIPLPARRRLEIAFDKIAYELDLWNRRSASELPGPRPETLRKLRGHYAQDVARLEEIIGAPTPWPRTEASPSAEADYHSSSE
jgi:hypothetical protein